MPTTTTCPACRGALRVPDELVGQPVRCPVCQTVFDAKNAAPTPAPASERPLWKDLDLQLDNNDPAREQNRPAPEPPPRPAPARSPRLVGAVELQPTDGEPPAPRPSSAPPRRQPPPRSGPRDYPPDEDDRPRRSPYDRDPRRRDAEPHRGALILVLGIVSLVFTLFSMCYGLGILVGLPLGVTAWALGSGDLRKIKNQEMDEEGLGITQAGWICGIIGTILHTLILLTCGALITILIVEASNAPGGPPAKPQFGAPGVVAPNR